MASRSRKNDASKKTEVAKSSNELPNGAWAQKCIKKRKLLPPYEKSVTEPQWQAYFNERSSLDAKSVEDDDEDYSATVLKRSQANLRRVVKGIKLIDNLDVIDALEEGIYVIKDSVVWEDCDEPRSIELDLRLYSPIGNASAVQFQYDYHLRPRATYVEYFVKLYGAVRSPTMLGKPQPDLEKNGTLLFSKTRNDKKRKFDRTVPSVTYLKNYEDAIFGTVGKISALKMLKVVGSAAGCDTHGESEFNDWVVRIAIRDKNMKMNKNEVSDAEDEDFSDDAKSNETEPPSHEESDEDSSDDEGHYPNPTWYLLRQSMQ